MPTEPKIMWGCAPAWTLIGTAARTTARARASATPDFITNPPIWIKARKGVMYYHARVMMRRASSLSGGLVVLLVLFQTLTAAQDKPAAVTAVDTLADALTAAGSAAGRQGPAGQAPGL